MSPKGTSAGAHLNSTLGKPRPPNLPNSTVIGVAPLLSPQKQNSAGSFFGDRSLMASVGAKQRSRSNLREQPTLKEPGHIDDGDSSTPHNLMLPSELLGKALNYSSLKDDEAVEQLLRYSRNSIDQTPTNLK